MVNILQESIKESFCESDETVRGAYEDLITSSKETLDSILELQEVWIVSKFKLKKMIQLLNIVVAVVVSSLYYSLS